MTQKYYVEGSLRLNIRNCSNNHILMSNADAIDRTNQARVNGLVVYTDIIDDFKKVVINGQLNVMVPYDIFNQKMEYTDDGFARPIEKKTESVKDKQEKKTKKNTEKEISIILEYSRMKRKLNRDRRRYKKKLHSKNDHL